MGLEIKHVITVDEEPDGCEIISNRSTDPLYF